MRKLKRFRTENKPLYSVWQGMKGRCYNPNATGYQYYGGRGITVCEEWKNSFLAFSADMLPTYKPGLQIDRIDNDGNYFLENCRWVTPLENNHNRKTSKPNTQKLVPTSSARFIVLNEIANKSAHRENA